MKIHADSFRWQVHYRIIDVIVRFCRKIYTWIPSLFLILKPKLIQNDTLFEKEGCDNFFALFYIGDAVLGQHAIQYACFQALISCDKGVMYFVSADFHIGDGV